jgi:hypothetical protein
MVTRFVEAALRENDAPPHDDTAQGFVPSPAELDRCLREYHELLGRVADGHPAYIMFTFAATEVAAAYLHAARRNRMALPPIAQALERRVAAVESSADAFLVKEPRLRGDWRDRLSTVRSLLQPYTGPEATP